MTDSPRSSRPPRPREPNIATEAARGRRTPSLGAGRPTSEPLYQTSVYDFASIPESEPALSGQHGYAYSRFGRPNADSFELSMAALENTESALATANGMTAILCALFAGTKAGDLVLCQSDVYGGTRALFDHDAGRLGLVVEYVDAYEPLRVADGLSRGARFVLVESLSNPLLRETDLAAISWHTRAAGALLCVDNTFATPALRRPHELGADLVMHSATKFLGGHDDVCAGVLTGKRELIDVARAASIRMGLSVSPLDAWLAQRGLRTLSVRMQRSQASARLLAPRLSEHRGVRQLHYPGWGSLLSFDVGTRAQAEQVVAQCAQIPLRPSLGGTDSSLSHSASSSHRGLSAEQRARLGIGEGLLRMSVGLEDPEDLWAELSRALGS